MQVNDIATGALTEYNATVVYQRLTQAYKQMVTRMHTFNIPGPSSFPFLHHRLKKSLTDPSLRRNHHPLRRAQRHAPSVFSAYLFSATGPRQRLHPQLWHIRRGD